jgi:hypothetical protein
LETDKTVKSVQTQIQYLEAVAETLAPDDPLRTELGNYIAQLSTVPDTVNTEMAIDTEAALRKLRELQAFVDSIEGDIAGLGGGGLPGFMAGGPVRRGGAYRVGEAGPETVVLPGGSQLLTAGRTMMAGSSAGPTIHYHITVNAPALSNPAEIGGTVVNAIKAYERRSGKSWRAA